MKEKLILTVLIALMLATTSVKAQTEDTEWIEVYFNMPADTSVMASGNRSNHSWDLIGTLTQLIDSATTSVDLCIYDLENIRVAEALSAAKARGVRVRVVTDNYNRTDGGEIDVQMWEHLKQAGIYSIDDDGDVYKPDGSISDNKLVNAGADMHNKFAVIDWESPSKNDDIVWTGSTNLTYTGAFNTNDVIVIKDSEVAGVYTEEFEQMWGGKSDIPNPKKARFHKDKKDVSKHVFDVGGTKLELYFAPVNRDRSKPSISDRIVEVIKNETQSDIRFQAFSITPTIELSKAIWEKSENPEIRLEGVIDRSFYSRYKKAGEIWGVPEAQTGNRLILPSDEMRKLHHKVLIIDASNPDPKDEAVVIAGSYNFSNNAELNNDENLLIIYSDKIANYYYQDFAGVLSRAEGRTTAPAPAVSPDKWYNVFSVRDGSTFEIEVAPGFGYPVRLLGVNMPALYAGPDSSYYFSSSAAGYMKNLLEGRRVKIQDYDGSEPFNSNNTFYGYVTLETESGNIALNQAVLANGYGTTSSWFKQDPDSVAAYKMYSEKAELAKKGIWKDSSKIGQKVPKKSELSGSSGVLIVYPINVNEADQATLELLPGIGPSYAKRIIEYREANGGFDSISELINIKGIGEKRLAKIRPLISVD